MLVVLIVLVAAIFVTFLLVSNGSEDWKLLLPLVGGAISLIYIIEKQHLDEAALFRQLFTEFNARYDKLNEKLNGIRLSEQKLKNDDFLLLHDYFNLCSEEYLFYTKGFIYPEVWQSWVNGMKGYYCDPRIAEVWKIELANGSHYGLNMEREIQRAADGIKY